MLDGLNQISFENKEEKEETSREDKTAKRERNL